jgi:hypothetical protein
MSVVLWIVTAVLIAASLIGGIVLLIQTWKAWHR